MGLNELLEKYTKYKINQCEKDGVIYVNPKSYNMWKGVAHSQALNKSACFQSINKMISRQFQFPIRFNLTHGFIHSTYVDFDEKYSKLLEELNAK